MYPSEILHWWCGDQPDTYFLLQYCTGDLWSGTITKATTASFGFYFAGHLNLMASIDFLIATTSLGR